MKALLLEQGVVVGTHCMKDGMFILVSEMEGDT